MDSPVSPLMDWIKMYLNGCQTAEILMAAEMVEVDPIEKNLQTIATIEDHLPTELEPKMMDFKVTAIFYGIRGDILKGIAYFHEKIDNFSLF